MKQGDWVIHEDGRAGYITVLDYVKDFHLVMFDDSFARMTHKHYLTVVDKPVADILTAVNTQERE